MVIDDYLTIEESLDTLPIYERRIIILNFIEGYTCEQIGIMTNLTQQRIDAVKQVALRKLRFFFRGDINV